MIEAPHILIFDSGAGGLSVAAEIIRKFASAQAPIGKLSYFADNEFFPYGTKEDKELVERIVSQVNQAYRNLTPDIVVLACNTASTLALDRLRQTIPCPIVGVVPAIKPAAMITRTGVIGVLATPATVDRPYTQTLIQDFAPHQQVLLHGSDRLVAMAEESLTQETIDLNALEQELGNLFCQTNGDQIDTVVLACTHFPLLKPQMREIRHGIPQTIHWIDSGEAIARRVLNLTYQKEPNNQSLSTTNPLQVACYFSSSQEAPKHEYQRYLNSVASEKSDK